MSETHRKCKTCGITLPIDGFSFCNSRAGRRLSCKKCLNARQKGRREADPDKYKNISKRWRDANKDQHASYNTLWHRRNKDKSRSIQLKCKYGITLREYEYLVVAQNNSCAICGITFCSTKDVTRGCRPCVDHDHITDKVRGILCNDCNSGIGFLKEDTRVLSKAITYLNYHALPD